MQPKEVKGVGVLITRNNMILLGLRIGAHGAETWSPPGGKPKDAEESPGETAVRETDEETGLTVYAMKQGPVCTNYFPELNEVHRSMFIEAATSSTQEPELREPHKCKEWRWFDWYNLPSNLFPPFKSLVEMGYLPRGIVRKKKPA